MSSSVVEPADPSDQVADLLGEHIASLVVLRDIEFCRCYFSLFLAAISFSTAAMSIATGATVGRIATASLVAESMAFSKFVGGISLVTAMAAVVAVVARDWIVARETRIRSSMDDLSGILARCIATSVVSSAFREVAADIEGHIAAGLAADLAPDRLADETA